MEFFSTLPPEPRPEQPVAPVIQAWVQPPQDEVPVAVPMVRRLAQVPGAALTLRRFDVYREGVAIDLRLDIRLEDDLTPERREQLEEMLDPRTHRWGGRDILRLGITLPDGTRAETGPNGRIQSWTLHQGRPEQPQLVMFGGGGSGDAYRWMAEARAWLWPLPPDGALTLHFLAATAGIPEGSVDIASTPLLEAASGVLDVWPD